MGVKAEERKSSREAQAEELEVVKTKGTDGHHNIGEKEVQTEQDVYEENGVHHKVCRCPRDNPISL